MCVWDTRINFECNKHSSNDAPSQKYDMTAHVFTTPHNVELTKQIKNRPHYAFIFHSNADKKTELDWCPTANTQRVRVQSFFRRRYYGPEGHGSNSKLASCMRKLTKKNGWTRSRSGPECNFRL